MKTCIHDGCTNPIWGGGYCKYHQANRKPLKSNKTKISKPSFRRRPTGEAQMFKDIISKLASLNAYKCFVTGRNLMKYLEREEISWVFSTMAHVLPKRKYPLFRLYDDNILPLDIDIHHIFDQQRHKATGKEWEPLFDYEGRLLYQYSVISKVFTLSDFKGLDHLTVTSMIHDAMYEFEMPEGS